MTVFGQTSDMPLDKESSIGNAAKAVTLEPLGRS